MDHTPYDSLAVGTVPYDDLESVSARFETTNAPAALYDINNDGTLDWWFSDNSVVQLPIDEDLTPFAWLEEGFAARDVTFYDVDGDGLDEWIFISPTSGPDGLKNGLTVLPGNWP